MVDLSILGHAFFVHFAVGLFVASTVAYLVSAFSEKYVIKYQSRLLARWSLWGAAGTIFIALILGFYAYSVAGHDDMSHLLLNEHRNMGSAVGLFIIVLSLWAGVLFNDDKEEGKRFLIVHVITAFILIYVTWIGSLLVYQYGVGVNSLAHPETHNHRMFKKASDDSVGSAILDIILSR